jgi:hypothetical protein
MAMSSALIAVLIRTVAFVAVFLVYVFLVEIPDDDGLGTGLLAFATCVVIALVWGGYDGWRGGLGRVVLLWLAVGALTPLGMELVLRVNDGALDSDAGDLLGFVVLMVVLIAVPAIVAGAVGAVLRRLRSAPAR